MKDSPRYQLIQASLEWADRCREFCRQAYLAAYVRPELGITEDLFSPVVFSSPRIIQYYQDLCTPTDTSQPWLAVDDNNDLIGTVVAEIEGNVCRMRSFYVSPKLKGQGIGHALYGKVLEIAGDRTIEVDVVEYMQETIDMYKHWGFKIDAEKGKLIYQIVEWPEEARQAYQAIYMTKPGKAQ